MVSKTKAESKPVPAGVPAGLTGAEARATDNGYAGSNGLSGNQCDKTHPLGSLAAVLELLAWVLARHDGTRRQDMGNVWDEVVKVRLFAVAYRILRDGSTQAAEDAREAVQTWILRMVDGSLRGFDFRRPFGPFAYKILVNICVDILRRRSRDHADPIGFEVAARTSCPAVLAALKDSRAKVRREVRKLPKRHRQAIILKYWLGYSSACAAARLGVSVARINGLNFEAREMLRPVLADLWG